MSVHMTQHNLRPYINATLKDANGVVNLTGETVQFVLNDSTGGVKVDETSTGDAVVVVGATSGHVRYKWQDGDTDTAGSFFGEFRTTNASTEPASYPNFGQIHVLIEPALST